MLAFFFFLRKHMLTFVSIEEYLFLLSAVFFFVNFSVISILYWQLDILV
jgi:hypothetical protein